MKHLTQDEDGVWDIQRYFAYLETIRDELTDSLRAFATDIGNYSFSSPTSLHDAALNALTIREIAGDGGRRTIAIETAYLGPEGDSEIHIDYGGVVGYDLHYRQIVPEIDGYGRPPVHGDVIAHEVRIDRPGIFTHELFFADCAGFTIHFKDFEHRIVPLPGPV